MAFPDGWGRRAPIVIDQVQEALTAFPVHLDADCFPAEALTTGDANAAKSDGSDLRFSSDLAGTTELPFEVVRWTQDATPANALATVYVATDLSATATTTIYVWYKNASATMPASTDANGSEAVWDADFVNVHHLNSTSAAPNSTGGTAGTWEGSPATTVESPVGIAVDLDASNDAVSFGTTNYADQTWELILKNDATTDQITMGKTGGTGPSLSVWVSGSKPAAFLETAGGFPYDHTLADTVNATTTAWEYWAVRKRSNTGLAVSKAVPSTEQTHQAHATDGTYLYSIGGHQTNTASPVTANNRYDPSANTWSSMTALPAARWGMASVYLGGNIYCMGGRTNATTASSRNDIYSISGNSWSAGAALPAALTTDASQGCTACTDGTDIYVLAVTKLYKYNVAGDSWSALTDAPLTLGNWTSLICDGSVIYVLSADITSPIVRRYTISSDTWDTTNWGTQPVAGWAKVCEPVGDGSWLVGFGRVSGGLEQKRELYNYVPSTDTWTKLDNYDAPTNAAASAIISGKLYVYGYWVIGKAETYSAGHHACYNISTAEWETSPAVGDFHRDATCISGKIITAALFANTGTVYVGRQDGFGSNYSGAKVAEFRRSDVARSRGWVNATYQTLLDASNFAVVGAAGGPITGTGAIASATAAIAGTGLREVTGTAALASGAATVAGTGAVGAVVTGTGALAAGASTTAGTGVRDVTGTAALASAAATIAGVAEREVTGTAALDSAASTLAGTGTVTAVGVVSGTGALVSQAAAIAGTGILSRNGTGALAAGLAVIDATGIIARNATGALASGAATVAGTGNVFVPGSIIGTAVLSAGTASIAGTGLATPWTTVAGASTTWTNIPGATSIWTEI